MFVAPDFAKPLLSHPKNERWYREKYYEHPLKDRGREPWFSTLWGGNLDPYVNRYYNVHEHLNHNTPEGCVDETGLVRGAHGNPTGKHQEEMARQHAAEQLANAEQERDFCQRLQMCATYSSGPKPMGSVSVHRPQRVEAPADVQTSSEPYAYERYTTPRLMTRNQYESYNRRRATAWSSYQWSEEYHRWYCSRYDENGSVEYYWAPDTSSSSTNATQNSTWNSPSPNQVSNTSSSQLGAHEAPMSDDGAQKSSKNQQTNVSSKPNLDHKKQSQVNPSSPQIGAHKAPTGDDGAQSTSTNQQTNTSSRPNVDRQKQSQVTSPGSLHIRQSQPITKTSYINATPGGSSQSANLIMRVT